MGEHGYCHHLVPYWQDCDDCIKEDLESESKKLKKADKAKKDDGDIIYLIKKLMWYGCPGHGDPRFEIYWNKIKNKLKDL